MGDEYGSRQRARIFSDADWDAAHLTAALDQLGDKLNQPYLQRRQQNLNPDPLIELQASIEEIQDRERELMAAVGIAKILLDKNKSLVDKLTIRHEEWEDYKVSNANKIEESRELRKILEEMETKMKILEDCSTKNELENQLLREENAQNKAEVQRLITASNSLSAFTAISPKLQEIEENTTAHKLEQKQKEYNVLQAEQKRLQIELQGYEKSREESNEKMYKLREKVEKWENQNIELQQELDKAERGWKKEEGKVIKLKRELQSEKRRNSVLNGDMINLKQVKPDKKSSKPKGLSLFDEMETKQDNPAPSLALEMNFDEEEMFMPQAMTVQNRATIGFTPKGGTQTQKAFDFPFGRSGLSNSEVFQLEVIPEKAPEPKPEVVSPEQSTRPTSPAQTETGDSPGTRRRKQRRALQQRKPAIEEYFALAAQSVKLNSPYMDTICTIPTDLLFAKAMADAVPFHRWHIWVENYLNKEYIKSMYSSSSRKK